jgi:tripartite-type tricarboxylate transporter receptor subunit TctC
MAPHVIKVLPYSTSRDFTPIAMLITSPYLLGVSASLPLKSVPELVAYAKARPSAVFYGSSGNGSALHVVAELVRTSTGMPATHVPYKSSVAAQTDLMAGQIQMMVDNFSTMAPNVQSGRVRALAITGSHRSPLLPEVPTFAELGIPIADAVAWGGIVGPAKLPAEVVSKLNSEINKVLADPKVQKQLANTASDVMPMSAVDFTRYIKAQDAKWAAVIKNANITAD